jgi:hypothetical protein
MAATDSNNAQADFSTYVQPAFQLPAWRVIPGQVESAGFTAPGSNGGMSNSVVGSGAGTDVAGSAATSAVASGMQAAASSPTGQPIFWLMVLLVLGVVMLAHVARLEMKG